MHIFLSHISLVCSSSTIIYNDFVNCAEFQHTKKTAIIMNSSRIQQHSYSWSWSEMWISPISIHVIHRQWHIKIIELSTLNDGKRKMKKKLGLIEFFLVCLKDNLNWGQLEFLIQFLVLLFSLFFSFLFPKRIAFHYKTSIIQTTSTELNTKAS